MMEQKNRQGVLEPLYRFAELLGVDLKKPKYSVTTPKSVGRIKMHDNTLEIALFPDGIIEIEGLRGVGLQVMYIDKNGYYNQHREDYGIPPEAVYKISCYKPEPESKGVIPGVIYIGPNGKVIKVAGLHIM